MAWGERKGTRVSLERAIDALLIGIDSTWHRDCKPVDVSVSGARHRRGLQALRADPSEW
jgi:hypothetical protein